MTKTIYANWSTHEGSRFEFTFGAYGNVNIVVFGRPDHLEDALEEAAECLKEHAPGMFVEPDYEAAKADIMGETGCGDDMVSEEDIFATAEADLTYTESGWLNSWEWHVNESEDDRQPFHYVYGSGMSGCLYDNGPYTAETLEDAINGVLLPFTNGDCLSEEEENQARIELAENGIYWFDKPSETGAHYCEVSKENEPMPIEDSEE